MKVTRGFDLDGSRYPYDQKLCREGWKQFDTTEDAWYFGIWVQVQEFKIVTFAEGDLTEIQCESEDEMRQKLKEMEEFYGSPPPAFRVIDSDGTLTEYYDERPSL